MKELEARELLAEHKRNPGNVSDEKIATAMDVVTLADAKAALETEAREKGFDVDFESGFIEAPPTPPKARLMRRATVGDTLRAEELARTHYGIPRDRDPSGQQIMTAKLALLMKFDDTIWNIPLIEALDLGFFAHVVVKFSEYLA